MSSTWIALYLRLVRSPCPCSFATTCWKMHPYIRNTTHRRVSTATDPIMHSDILNPYGNAGPLCLEYLCPQGRNLCR